jgi:voltage-gated sodium channel
MSMSISAIQEWRAQLSALLERPAVERLVVTVIIVNAVTLGLETSAAAMALAGPLLHLVDRAALAFFVVELALRVLALGRRFFREPWNLFDFVIVGIALLPQTGGLSVLRSLRILRALRLVSAVPAMRRVVGALLSALPGMGSVAALLLLVFYVFAVMATKLFGPSFPEWFGTLGASLYSLFQIMTLESWSMGIVRPVMVAHPLAWLFFVPFILVTTFAVLNLFIAIIVNAMQAGHQADSEQLELDHREVMAELRALRAELEALRRERGRAPVAEAG